MFGSLIISAFICANGQSAAPDLTPIDLGTSADFTILTKTGVTTTTGTTVTGDIGVSPAAIGVSPEVESSITGFALSLDASSSFSTSDAVIGGGRIYASDHFSPTPAKLTTAILDMQTAYTAAAGDNGALKSLNLKAGLVDDETLEGGVHKWTTGVSFPNFLTFDALGDENTTWIMQIAGSLDIGTDAEVKLTNGAQASKIFWAVAGETNILARAHAKGIILCATKIALRAGASLTGRALAQTAVTMISNTIQPDA